MESAIADCAKIYSEHYGVWGERSGRSGRKGEHIKLSAQRLQSWLNNENTGLYVASYDEKLIGYAIALRAILHSHGTVSWVTQFVVHTDYQNNGIGSHLLRHIWGMSNDYAWGLITSNPYAVRALEKATRRNCDPKYISGNGRVGKLLNFASKKVHYIDAGIECKIGSATAQVNTNFCVDHSNIESKIKALEDKGINWKMGALQECWEWFAFTFRNQEPFPLEKAEIESILRSSEKTVKQAYKRMFGGQSKPYTKYTDTEVSFIFSECRLRKDSVVFDFGCGTGRHAIGLAFKGVVVRAFDYVEENIEACKRNQPSMPPSGKLTFQVDDCRDLDLPEQADAVICLYDVIGSFKEEADNVKIIKNIATCLKPGGTALISVMNSGLTRGKVREFAFSKDPNTLFELGASETMQRSGEVFNPDLMFFDTDSEVFYRREQFLVGSELPVELFVCDRRYTKDSISRMCEDAGLRVDFVRRVHAGDWQNDLPESHGSAKEVLVKCTRVV
jgi:2-polyprenyl-3-methyl-5-hydroxy-6-metoxy-1,4-benzoquinol methylase/GNAT superfamily N-acetyltransferase